MQSTVKDSMSKHCQRQHVKAMSKTACQMDESLTLLELLLEAIISSHFVQETLQKSEFVVNVEKLILKTQETQVGLRIVLDLTTKTFSHK